MQVLQGPLAAGGIQAFSQIISHLYQNTLCIIPSAKILLMQKMVIP